MISRSIFGLFVLLGFVSGLFCYSAQRLYFTTDGSQGGTSVEPGFDFNHIWNAMGVGMNGHVYVAVSNTLQSEPPGGTSPQKGNTVVVTYNPYNGTFRSCHTVKSAAQAAGNWMSNESQEKIHTFLCPAPDGKLWMATHDNAEVEPGDPLYYTGLFYRGSHILYIDVFNGDTLVDYSATQKYYYKKETPVPSLNQSQLRPSDTAGVAIQWHSIMILGLNPHIPRYLWSVSIGGTGFLQVWDLVEDTTRTIGVGPGNMRHMAVSRQGNVYYNETSTAYKCSPNSTQKTIVGTDLPGSGAGMCYTHSWDSAYVSLRGSGEVILYDMVNDVVKQIADLPDAGSSAAAYRCLTISADGQKLYVIGNSGNIYEVNVATGNYTSVFNVSTEISGYGMVCGGGIVDTAGNWYAGMHGRGAALLKINMGKDLVTPVAQPPISVEKEVLARLTPCIIEAFPNPFKAAVSFKINLPGRANLYVYNAAGRRMAVIPVSENSAKIVWNASDAPAGIYFARLVQGTTSYSRKLLLMK